MFYEINLVYNDKIENDGDFLMNIITENYVQNNKNGMKCEVNKYALRDEVDDYINDVCIELENMYKQMYKNHDVSYVDYLGDFNEITDNCYKYMKQNRDDYEVELIFDDEKDK